MNIYFREQTKARLLALQCACLLAASIGINDLSYFFNKFSYLASKSVKKTYLAERHKWFKMEIAKVFLAAILIVWSLVRNMSTINIDYPVLLQN